jgi:hypothetical protein
MFAIVSVALVVTGANFSKHQDVLQHMERSQEEAKMQKLETTYGDHEGLTHTIITPRNEGEDPMGWAARHKEAVLAMKVAFPPKPV